MNVGSRKEVHSLIKKKVVTVNGELVTTPKQQVKEDDLVVVDGNEIAYQQYHYFLLNKPKGVISATEDRSQQTVISLLKTKDRYQGIAPVGRLDKDTTGLLIITNDGKFAHNIISPKKHVSKTYEAVVTGKISEKEVKTFSQGMELANGDKLQPAQLDIISYSEKDDTSKVRVIIHEGKYHQVRRMFGAVSQRVLELDRVKIGLLELDDTLERGEYRKLTEEELNLIK